jgi:type IV pilus assembly protein PilW
MNKSLHPARTKIQAGFSLVELMVAMTIGFIVVASVGYVYLGSRSAFRTTDNMSRMQESARYALDTMTRDIRMAGYRGCASSTGKFTNTLAQASATAYNFGVPLEGFDAAGAAWSPALPTGTGGLSGLSIKAGTDAIIMRSAFGGGASVTQQPGNTSADLKVTTPNDLAIDDIVMVSDCSAAAVFQITNMNVSGTGQNVVHNTGVGTPGNSTQDLGQNFVNGEIIKMQSKTYFIRTGASGRAALWQFDNYQPLSANNPAEIAEGIENMQILYGIDANSDGAVESYTTAAVVANWNQVAAVRINVLVSSPENNVTTSTQTYNFNNASVTAGAGDRRMYQTFTATIGVRNRLP